MERASSGSLALGAIAVEKVFAVRAGSTELLRVSKKVCQVASGEAEAKQRDVCRERDGWQHSERSEGGRELAMPRVPTSASLCR